MKPYDDSRPKGAQVEAMFDGIAPVYDRLNDIMSFGIARRWRRVVVKCVMRALNISEPSAEDANELVFSSCHPERARRATRDLCDPSFRILDLATGTGDLAIALARRLPEAHITGADPSEGMLEIARRKAARATTPGKGDEQSHAAVGRRRATLADAHVAPAHYGSLRSPQFVRAQAEKLPFDDGVFDAVTAAFGVRNFDDILQGLKEMHRVTADGGSVFILEFSTPRSRVFGLLFGFYFHRVLPRIGALLSKDRRAYTYLPDSVDEFPAPVEFVRMLKTAGFKSVTARPLTGGVAYIYMGTK